MTGMVVAVLVVMFVVSGTALVARRAWGASRVAAVLIVLAEAVLIASSVRNPLLLAVWAALLLWATGLLRRARASGRGSV